MTDNTNDDDLELQQDELLALQSIYDEKEFKIRGEKQGIFNANVEHFMNVVQLILSDDSNIPNSLKHLCERNENSVVYSLRYLPPLTLKFEYPNDYPSSSNPKLSLNCIWMTGEMLQQIKEQLIKEWEETRDVVLFSWTSFLINESWAFLGLTNQFKCPEFIDTAIIDKLCIFDHEKKLSEFSRTPHKCDVCFEEYKGSQCMQFLPCDHVFCKICMKGYFEVLINSGDVNQLLCPKDKCESIALPTQVKELVEIGLYERYERFLLQRTLDQMSDVVRCPRKFCLNSVLKDNDSNMAQCNSCHFIFCILCEKTWHGEHTPCEIKSGKFLELYKAYQSSSDSERQALYKKYGKAQVVNVVAEIESAEYLKNNSKPCPNCGAAVQLGMGCNKIVCSVCSNYMCYLCGKSLNKSDPYAHFRPGGPCENKLYEGTVENDAWVDDFDEDSDDDFIIFV